MKTIWKKNFSASRIDYNILVESCQSFYNLQKETVGKNIFTKELCLVRNLVIEGFYFPKNELLEMIDAVIEILYQNPRKLEKVHKKTVELNKKYFDFAEKLRKIDLSIQSNSQLLSLHKRLYKLQHDSHGWSLPSTWTVDSENETLSKSLSKLLEQKISGQSLPYNVPHVFSVLTTSHKTSYAQIEEKESLQILEAISRNKKVKQWFTSHTTQELLENFSQLPSSLRKRIQAHHYKWCWVPYTYLGPAYGLDYYLEVWRGLLHEGISAKEEWKEKEKKNKAVQIERHKIARELKLSDREKRIFDVAAEIVWLKGYRKDCYFHGFYVLDLLLAEMAKRTQHSLLQVKYLLVQELPRLLKGKDYSEIANERMKYSVIYQNGKKTTILTGSKAKVFIKKQKIEREKIILSDTVTGTPACAGLIQGTVKVINTPDEMSKMNFGDIMLAHTTFPSLVPAMKKAAAIVTEDGGITCHAAIVARELQTPCVVGCKNILMMFKDGDKIEVDANQGIVKKL